MRSWSKRLEISRRKWPKTRRTRRDEFLDKSSINISISWQNFKFLLPNSLTHYAYRVNSIWISNALGNRALVCVCLKLSKQTGPVYANFVANFLIGRTLQASRSNLTDHTVDQFHPSQTVSRWEIVEIGFLEIFRVRHCVKKIWRILSSKTISFDSGFVLIQKPL